MLTAAGALYAPVVGGMVRQWYEQTDDSYGALLAVVAIIVAFRRRTRLRTLPASPANIGFAVLAFALLIYVLGFLVGDLFLMRVSLPLACGGAIAAVWGTAHARALAAPLGLFVLAVPLPAVLVTHLTLPLQLVASQIAAGVLAVCQVPVAREGNLLLLPHITLEVAEACSGLRSVTSLIAVGAVCGAMMQWRARRTVAVMIAAVPIAVVGNGLRVAATGLLTVWIGEVAVRGVVHELTGVIAFLVMCAATLAVDILARSRLQAGRRLHASRAVTA